MRFLCLSFNMAGQTVGLHGTVTQNDSQIALGLDLFWKARNMENVKKAGVPKQILSSTPNYTTGKPERICSGTPAFLTSLLEVIKKHRVVIAVKGGVSSSPKEDLSHGQKFSFPLPSHSFYHTYRLVSDGSVKLSTVMGGWVVL